jgi:hypothetical protein
MQHARADALQQLDLLLGATVGGDANGPAGQSGLIHGPQRDAAVLPEGFGYVLRVWR